MATTKFYLKSTQDQNKPSLIYMFFSYDGRRLKYSSSEKVPPKYWNESTLKVKRSFTGGADINMHLKTLEAKTLEIYRHYRLQGDIPTPSELREKLNESYSKTAKDKLTFYEVYDEFIHSQKSKVHERTICKYNTLKRRLKEFEKYARYSMKFDNINLSFYDKYVNFCIEELNIVNNTTDKHITTLKVFLNWATDRGYNTNLKYKKFKSLKEESDIVYLEYEELILMYHHDFSNDSRLARIRDAFCLCCFTGMRYSDLKQLRPEHVKGDFIKIKIYKTKETLRIPLNEFAMEIISRHFEKDGFLQVISNQKMNKHIKVIAKKAGIDTPVTLTKIKGVQRIEVTKPKYELVSTHTGRRTFVTVSLEKGMRPEIVMKITGHKSYDVFKKYIQITDKIKDVEMQRVWNLSPPQIHNKLKSIS